MVAAETRGNWGEDRDVEGEERERERPRHTIILEKRKAAPGRLFTAT